MALHKQIDFAKLCGVSTAYLSVNKKRGKIILSGDYVDDNIEPNISFLQKCLIKKSNKSESETELVEINEDVIGKEHERVFPKKPKVTSPTLIRRQKPNVRAPEQTLTFQLDNAKKLVDTENSKLLQEIRRAKLKQLYGETIPTDMVRMMIQTHFKNFAIAFKNAMEKSLTRWSKHFTPEEIAEARKQIVGDINKGIENAINETGKVLQEIINESSNKKEVGERE